VTTRTFEPWANRKPRTDPGHQTRETIRTQGHHDWDTICDHWANIAHLANEKITLAAPGETSGGGTTTTTERNAHLERVAATAWLTELNQVRSQLQRTAARARDIDKPVTKGTTKPGDQIENCLLCDLEIGTGANGRPDCHRIDGHPFHATTCYYQLYRQAEKEHTIIGTLAEQLHRKRENVQVRP